MPRKNPVTRFLLTASLMAALSLLPVPVEAAPEAIAGDVYFDGAQRQLYLPWYEGVPAVLELAAPHRLVIEVPWTSRMGEGFKRFDDEWVQAIRIQRSGVTARVEVRLNKPLKGDWHPTAGRGVFSLRVGPPVRQSLQPQPSPTAKPQPSPTAKPQPSPTAKPQPSSTAKPQPSPTAKPQPSPTAKPQPSPTAKPQPSPTAKPQPSPTAKPQPSPTAKPQPSPTAKPQPSPTAKPQPSPTAKPQPSQSPKVSPAKPGSSAAARPRVGRFTYDEEVRYFLLPVSRKVVPVFTELQEPPRLVIDLPGVDVPEPLNRSYPGSLVREAALAAVPGGGAQATLTLARPIANQWKWKQSGNNLVVVFDHRPVAAGPIPAIPAPSATPQAAPPPAPVLPSPKAEPTPSPIVTTPSPGPSVTPAPVSSKPPVKASIPVPVVSPVAAATRPPSAAPRRPRTGHAFSGTVYNINSGAPLAGVRVTIAGDTAVSDRDGRFELLGVAAGAHSVSVAADGFSPQTFSILVPDDKSISLNLVPSL